MSGRLLLSLAVVVAVAGIGFWRASPRGQEQANVALTVRETRAGSAQVSIVHHDWPENSWRLRLPEYLIVYGQVDTKVRSSAAVDDDGVVTISGAKKSHGEMEYTFVLRPGRNKVDIEATVTNPGRRQWDAGAFALSCLQFSLAEEFFDYFESATFVMVDDTLRSIGEIARRHGQPEHFRHNGHALRSRDAKWSQRKKPEVEHVLVESSLIVRSSADGKRHVAQAWDDAFSVAYNFMADLNCTHSNPRFGAVGPGGTKTLHGRIYFFTGSLEELYEVFERDFPGLGYGGATR